MAVIHVNQADRYGNARIFGPSVAPVETAMASKQVILSTEELIEPEEIRRDPGRTTIPYYLVSAVVHAPYGAHPGTCPGLYAYDAEHLDEFFAARSDEQMAAYMDKYVFGTKDQAEYIEAVGGDARMQELRQRETIKEGYYE